MRRVLWIAALALALLLATGCGDDDTTGDAAGAGAAVAIDQAPTTTTAQPTVPSTATTDSTTATSGAPVTTTAPVTTAAPTSSAIRQISDLPVVHLDELPVQAIATLGLIRDGGPYPYRQDDSTFQNREGLLPDRPMGDYREYTVDTPGLDHRGARRIVTGEDGSVYYTDDHYASFHEVVP